MNPNPTLALNKPAKTQSLAMLPFVSSDLGAASAVWAQEDLDGIGSVQVEVGPKRHLGDYEYPAARLPLAKGSALYRGGKGQGQNAKAPRCGKDWEMTLQKRGDRQFNFRLPDELKKKIEDAATDNNRSQNSEVTARLTRSFMDDDRLRRMDAKLDFIIEAMGWQQEGVVAKKVVGGVPYERQAR